MAKLYLLIQIDLCPMCGNEIWPVENGFIGQQDVNKIPGETVFEIRCADDTGTNLKCGSFVIHRKDTESLEDDWTAEFAPTPGVWG